MGISERILKMKPVTDYEKIKDLLLIVIKTYLLQDPEEPERLIL